MISRRLACRTARMQDFNNAGCPSPLPYQCPALHLLQMKNISISVLI
ncbi:hypothetical protein MUU74_17240 [Chryseobacterium daecheongense]|nr:hypothetical protein [Chryseobacterium daecheongense]UOU98221.1 hypothetical protein MUU74_17240 [Chryseobacterium daecheongense]